MSPPDGTIVDGGSVQSVASAAASGASSVASGAASSAAVVSGGAVSSGSVASASVVSGGAVSATWPDNWRQIMAGGDEKLLAELGRYTDPVAVNRARVDARKQIDTVGLRKPLPDNATPEQLAEYRKENGIPETPDKYDLTLKSGLVVGEADKPLIDGFLKSAHGNNWSNAQVKQGLEWYYGQQDQLRLQQEEADAGFRHESIAKLGELYKGEYKRNVAHVDKHLQSAEFPAGIRDKILGARLPNGRLAGDDPEFVDYLFKEALFRNPIGSGIGGNSEAQIKSAEAERDALVKESGDHSGPYWKGPQAKAKQDRLLALNDSLLKLQQQRR